VAHTCIKNSNGLVVSFGLWRGVEEGFIRVFFLVRAVAFQTSSRSQEVNQANLEFRLYCDLLHAGGKAYQQMHAVCFVDIEHLQWQDALLVPWTSIPTGSRAKGGIH
jgi:hypothetical protein